MTLDELADSINAMHPGERLVISVHALQDRALWNTMRHGGGTEDFLRAIREKVIGSAYGTVEIWQHLDPPSMVFVKREAGARVFDRDGDPIRRT